jgi:malate synthase
MSADRAGGADRATGADTDLARTAADRARNAADLARNDADMAPHGVDIAPSEMHGAGRILTGDALSFVADLHRRFDDRRRELLAARDRRRAAIAAGERLAFLTETADVRAGAWTVAPAPPALVKRRVEITGPTDAKMAINALNSGANVWLADFEDANAPTWDNMVGGQVSLYRAIRGDLEYTSPEGKHYEVRGDAPSPVIVPRPRGWHLP